jgi:transcriptional regulator with AAA-type ATPase domain
MSVGLENTTLSATDDGGGSSDPRHCHYLFLVFSSHRPFSSSARIALEGIDEVVFGRGPSREIANDDAAGVRRLRVLLDDGWLSVRHARLTRVLRRWVLEDLGSKNGSFVDGVRKVQFELRDGALIEIGQTFFLFRDSVPDPPEGAPRVLEAGGAANQLQAFVTLSPALAQSFERLTAVARTRVSVLLEGETGTGKEVVARAIHAVSGRPGKFVAVNCGALPRELMEAELFGHRRGAFSGATADSLGLVRAAEGGTLMLDEVGDLPAAAQAVLLRVLQEEEVRPVGATHAVPVNLRVIAATHRPLDHMVESGAFRRDLLARLDGYRMKLPALSGRREDLGLLFSAIVRRADASLEGRLQVQAAAARALIQYGWPANIREFEKCLTAALSLAHESGRIELKHLPEALRRPPPSDPPAPEGEGERQRTELVGRLREHRGNVTAVAQSMGKARMQIQRWIKRFNIDVKSMRR